MPLHGGALIALCHALCAPPPRSQAAAKKAAAPLSSRGTAPQPQLAVDVPLGPGAGGASALPRLPFDAALDEDLGGPGSRGVVAL